MIQFGYVLQTLLIHLLQETIDPLQTLTISTNNPLRTRYIEYTPTLPSYPKSDPLGFTYIIDIRGAREWKDTVEVGYFSYTYTIRI